MNQWDDEGLTGSQLSWAAIEKEAYAVIRTWCFGVPISVFSNYNPPIQITSAATRSAKLTRWALALQEFDFTFEYCRGGQNVIPDFLSRSCGRQNRWMGAIPCFLAVTV